MRYVPNSTLWGCILKPKKDVCFQLLWTSILLRRVQVNPLERFLKLYITMNACLTEAVAESQLYINTYGAMAD